MKEEFLHYLWKYGLYDRDRLFDNESNKIHVIHPGEYNRDAGPDFFNARVRIGDTEWAGNVEIHTRASHYYTHGHHLDPSFDNVILHVVAENDKKVFNSKGEEILTTGLVYDSLLYDKYLDLVNNPCIIACQDDVSRIDTVLLHSWLDALVTERLHEKSDAIMKIYTETGHDWDETFYRVLTRYFGFRVNTEPFEMLANALPFRIIRKHSDNLFQIEALLFGTAGMLEEGLFKEAISDDYYIRLIREFRILSSKYSLHPLHGWIWKFCRLRPANFPTVRISQLAAMLSVTGGLFSRVVEAADIRQLREIFEVTASEYWDDHYIFGKVSSSISKRAGSQAADIFLINAVMPVIFFFGRARNSPDIKERAMDFLGCIRTEQNSIIDEWEAAGINAESAFYSQALLQLRNSYCKKRRCLECRIGAKLITLGRKFRNHDELILEP
ncbi:MAG: DUF2851 family protein [Bacteroidales bacterium]|nr:DUF2851 family protein [Bacteroidales bacterium]